MQRVKINVKRFPTNFSNIINDDIHILVEVNEKVIAVPNDNPASSITGFKNTTSAPLQK